MSAPFVLLLAGCGPKRQAPAPTPPQGAHVGAAPSSQDTGGEKADAPGLFRDVAQEAGLNFRWGHGSKSPLTIVETLGHGCAFLDYDQDGLLDILLVGNKRLALYHNVGNREQGTGNRSHPSSLIPHPFFKDVTAQSGLTAEGELWGVAVGDYDNDGYPDLYITGYGVCQLFHNEGMKGRRDEGMQQPVIPSRMFRDVTAQSGLAARGPYDTVTAAAFVDLDGDGRLDLFAGRYIVFTPKTIQFCLYSGVKAGCGVKNYDPDFPRVYRNTGNGAFTDVTKTWGFDRASGKCLGVAVRAQDSGKGVALYAANDEMPGDLFVPQGGRYVNNGVPSGTAFNRDGLTQGGMGVDWGDFNNDLRPDLVVSTFHTEAKSLYRSDGNDLYTEVSAPMGVAIGTSPYVAWTAKFFDYDNDGWQDLLFTNGHTQDNVQQTERDRTYPQPMLLYHNAQGRVFEDVRSQGGPAFQKPFVGRGAAFGDYDNDGRVDILLVDEEGAVKLLHNESGMRDAGRGMREDGPHPSSLIPHPSENHWLGVRLVGVRCNRDGIGARVLVTADGRTQTRDQQLCGGYISAHDPRLHFGLGTARRIEKIVVRWPDGHMDTVKNVPLDIYIEITEGKGLSRRENKR